MENYIPCGSSYVFIYVYVCILFALYSQSVYVCNFVIMFMCNLVKLPLLAIISPVAESICLLIEGLSTRQKAMAKRLNGIKANRPPN